MNSIIDGNNDLSNRVMTSSRPSSAIDPKFFHDTSIVLMSPVSSSRRTSIGNLYDIPYARNHNLLLNTNRSSILTIHKSRILRKKPLEKTFLDFKKWVKSIQTAGYNGARTVVREHPFMMSDFVYRL